VNYDPLTLAMLIGQMVESARVDIEAHESDPTGPALARAARGLSHCEAALLLIRATGADVPSAIPTTLAGLTADLIAHGAVLPYVLSDDDHAEFVGILALAHPQSPSES
jgi:hypothetical protein